MGRYSIWSSGLKTRMVEPSGRKILGPLMEALTSELVVVEMFVAVDGGVAFLIKVFT